MDEDRYCLHCKEKEKPRDALNHVGRFNENPINTLVEQADAAGLFELSKQLKSKKKEKTFIYMHGSCRTGIKNEASRKIKSTASSKETARSTRSTSVQFDFLNQCFYCTKQCEYDLKHPGRNSFRLVNQSGNLLRSFTLDICKNRTDDYAKAVEMRLLSVIDLSAANAKYHPKCRVSFESEEKKIEGSNVHSSSVPSMSASGRPVIKTQEEIFALICVRMENTEDLFTIKDFSDGMEEYGKSYCPKTIKYKLKSKYGNSVSFDEKPRQSAIVVLDMVKHMQVEDCYDNNEDKSKRIIKMAATILKNEMEKNYCDAEFYPSSEDIKEITSTEVPGLLMYFMEFLTKDELKQNSIAQSLVACYMKKSVLPLQFGLSVSMDNKFSSRWLINTLHRFGFACSYEELIRYKQNIVQSENVDNVLLSQKGEFIQYVGDNTDHDINTIDGKNTHHGLGSIIISNGSFGNQPIERNRVPRLSKQNWSTVTNNEGIPILEFSGTGDVLRRTRIETLSEIDEWKPNACDLLWICARNLKSNIPNWSGFMSGFTLGTNTKVSGVCMLPIIDLHATDPNALFSLLSFISKQCQRVQISETAVTFDQPLYIKAYEIVHSTGMKIFVRLGGFHQCMSFLGSIGCMMEGSGLREALETVYALITVGHMFSGKAYARAIRGHILASSALLSLILKTFFQTLSQSEIDALVKLAVSTNIPSAESPSMDFVTKWFLEQKDVLRLKSRTCSLWLAYIQYVLIVQDFIRAERSSDWLAHILASKRMLNLFAATGHSNYAKSCRLYLQTAENLAENFPFVYEQCMKGNHTVKRSKKDWCGLWTDLSIEQILMKSLKGPGGVIGRGLTENVLRVWTKTMHRFADVTEAIESLMDKEPESRHKETMPGRIKQDIDDFNKILGYFQNNNPFEIENQLMSLSSGLTDDNNEVNCDRTEIVGEAIQKRMDGKTYSEVKARKKDRITNLQSLHSTIKIHNEKVDINPVALFCRLITVVEREPESKISSFFEHELAPYPLSMFKDGLMRPATKSKLKELVLHEVPPTISDDSEHKYIVMDGGAFLWTCNWRKGECFSDIAEKYVTRSKEFNVDVIVFDGYETCTKSEVRSYRGKTAAGSVEISDKISSVTDRTTFLNNYTNKEKFIQFLGVKLTEAGVRVVHTPGDADTTIVSEALKALSDENVVSKVLVMADDTDILCLLLHHYQREKTQAELYIKNVTCKNASRTSGAGAAREDTLKTRVEYNIKDVLTHSGETMKKYILFGHAITGCDTVSAVYNLGKVSIYKMLHNSEQLRSYADIFYDESASQESIGNACIGFFETLFSEKRVGTTKSLSQIRHDKYKEMVASSRASIDPSCLPPTPRAAYFHGLRAYHQIKLWICLSMRDLEPTKWGYESKGGKLTPVMTDISPAPERLLSIIRCSCKKECSARCSCKKAGLQCATTCRECRGTTCSNGPQTEAYDGEAEQ